MSKESESLGHSITDLMTSLFVVFVLLLVAYINRSYVETRKGSQTIKEALVDSFKKVKIHAENDPKDPLALLISVRDDNLAFDIARSELKPNGEKFLKEFVPALAKVLTEQKFAPEVQSVVIEGHTDSDGNDENNLQLSQARSYSVLKFAINESGLTSQQRDFILDKISANGRGERDLLPMDSKPGFENKNLSRRVEFKIRVRSFEQRNLSSDGSSPLAKAAAVGKIGSQD